MIGERLARRIRRVLGRDPKPVTVTIDVDTTAYTAGVRGLREHLVDLAGTLPQQDEPGPAPEPEPARTVVTQTRGPIGAECNNGGHYDCQGCGCGCHPPEVIAQLAALSKTVGTAEATRIMTRGTT